MCEAFGGNAKAKALEVAIAVACQGQSKDNANLRAALKLRHFRGAPVVMCCVIFFCFPASAIFHPFVSLHSHMHTCTHESRWVLGVFYSIFYSAQREKDMREGVTGAGNCLVYAPFDVGDNPLMSFGLLQCISFGSLGSFCQLNFISLSTAWSLKISFFFGALCLFVLAGEIAHASGIGQGKFTLQLQIPLFGRH